MNAEQILRGFHAQHPGATAQTVGNGRAGTSSGYDLLVGAVEAAPAGAAVLDLACGDGYLLERVARARPDARATGIDMSEAELAAARRRLGPDADLRCERADALTLRDGSVDVVLCHLALMLMAPLDPVLDEIGRVLRPRGAFAAVLGGGRQDGVVWSAFGEVYRSFLERDGAAVPSFGDRRTDSAISLQELIAGHGAFRDARVDTVMVVLDGTPEEIATFFGLTYNAFALGEARPTFEAQLLARVAPLHDARGLVPLALKLLHLQATRA